jgi:predicted membrane channel-forming protein YqfA (hemolysin III family)
VRKNKAKGMILILAAWLMALSGILINTFVNAYVGRFVICLAIVIAVSGLIYYIYGYYRK